MVANIGHEQNNMDELGARFDNLFCVRCQDGFELNEQIVNSGGQVWHSECFVCAQCLLPFPDGIYYEFDGRKYCEHDFHVLYAPCCGKCNEFIVGRVIKAMNLSWHPKCFTCELCNKELADIGFLRNAGRALCRECNEREKAAGSGKYVCHQCHAIIEEEHIKYRGDSYHPYHFKCTNCSVELDHTAREVGGNLYCLRCHDTMGIPICGACHRPVEERVITALGKNWHVEHFVCSVCEKPFLGHKHYERKGLAYCEEHFTKLYGSTCFRCGKSCGGETFTALEKTWCLKCFGCHLCDKKMDHKSKFYEFDMKPTCKKCYDKFPTELKKRISDRLKERNQISIERQRRSMSPSFGRS
ncbi:AT21926p [Strongyloides ratti]|uniref:LIM domain-containing protein n=1 Tax=Strongyloides ratti TaxID=34506 RepID=A0A090MUZ3_STRRB|nr:AT21926p [Strongyloides ratti]CEF62538.1 AT21926p [Strongyloides ratti]